VTRSCLAESAALFKPRAGNNEAPDGRYTPGERNSFRRAVHTLSNQCPECGFDLEPGKPCKVCGHLPNARSEVPGTRQNTQRRRGSLGMLLASAGGLLAALAVFMALEKRSLSQDAVPTPAPAAAAQAAPAPSAEPGTAEPAAVPPLPEPSPAASPRAIPVPRIRPAAAQAVKLAGEKPRFTNPVLLSSTEQGFDITTRAEVPPVRNGTAFSTWMLAHTDQKAKFLAAKWERAQILLRTGNITHERVLQAFLMAPREYFCRDPRRAYESAVLPIGYGQTISGPHMVARMTNYLDPQPGQRVLEIGTGSGYQSAVLSELSNHVYTIEIVEELAQKTDAIYRRLESHYPEYLNIHRKVDDGYYGWQDFAPFDRIIVTCGIDHVPPELLRQLAPEGVMVIPVGPPSGQTILRITKHMQADGLVSLEREDIYQGKRKEIFVPFTSKGGGSHRADEATK
jgi:protein-L-isoaspartate(D-aspartate) O-methyltransferase